MGLRFLILLVCCCFLTACGGVVRPDAVADADKQRVKVLVEPVDGTSLPMGKLLAQVVAEELSGAGVTASMASLGPTAFILRGRGRPTRK